MEIKNKDSKLKIQYGGAKFAAGNCLETSTLSVTFAAH